MGISDPYLFDTPDKTSERHLNISRFSNSAKYFLPEDPSAIRIKQDESASSLAGLPESMQITISPGDKVLFFNQKHSFRNTVPLLEVMPVYLFSSQNFNE